MWASASASAPEGGDPVPAETAAARAGVGPALIDAHVHFYPGFDEARFLAGALGNVRARAAELGLAGATRGWLLMAETARDHAFAAFAERTAGAGRGGWSFRATGEAESLLACRDGHPVLGLVAGRQIVTAEGLEVLALATQAHFPDGGELGPTLDRVRAADAVAVLPWGFGKWSGRRGALVEARIREGRAGEIFLGDNGGRPAMRPRPRLLDLAEERGLAVLPGSDPLPIPGQEVRVASFGFVLDGIAEDRPAETIRARLRALAASPRAYGRGTSLAPFVRNQIFMQLRKHGMSR